MPGETRIPVKRLFSYFVCLAKRGENAPNLLSDDLGDIGLRRVLRQTGERDNNVTGMQATRAHPGDNRVTGMRVSPCWRDSHTRMAFTKFFHKKFKAT